LLIEPSVGGKAIACRYLEHIEPKLTGVNIVEGALNNSAVIDSLESYHPAAKLWGLHHKFAFQNKTWLPTLNSLLDLHHALVPPKYTSIKLRDSPKLSLQVLQEDISSRPPYSALLVALKAKIAYNIFEFMRLHPEFTTPAHHTNGMHTPSLFSP